MNPLKNIMSAVSAMMPDDTDPKNPVAAFIEAEFDKIFPGVEDVQLVKVLAVQLANDQPQECLNKLCAFSNDVSAFVTELNNPGDNEDGE